MKKRSTFFAQLIFLVILSLLAFPSLASADYYDGVLAYSHKDYTKAFKEWQVLAKAGHANSQYRLGRLYELGQGVPRNLIEAYRWYSLAAAQGHAKAKGNREWVSRKMSPGELARARTLASKPAASAQSSGPTKEQIALVQRLLSGLGLNPGPADGIMGAKTKKAIIAFQRISGLEVNGKVTPELIASLKEKNDGQNVVQRPLKKSKKAIIASKPSGSKLFKGQIIERGGNQSWSYRRFKEGEALVEKRPTRLQFENKSDLIAIRVFRDRKGNQFLWVWDPEFKKLGSRELQIKSGFGSWKRNLTPEEAARGFFMVRGTLASEIINAMLKSRLSQNLEIKTVGYEKAIPLSGFSQSFRIAMKNDAGAKDSQESSKSKRKVTKLPSASPSTQRSSKSQNQFGVWTVDRFRSHAWLTSSGQNITFQMEKIGGSDNYTFSLKQPGANLDRLKMIVNVDGKKFRFCKLLKGDRGHLCESTGTKFLSALMRANSMEISIGKTVRTIELKNFRKAFRFAVGSDEERRIARLQKGTNVARRPSVSSPPRQEKEVHAAAANVNKRDPSGFTPLHHAARQGNQVSARRLIRNGANVNAIVTGSLHRGETPLHFAAWEGHESLARILLRNGADVNAKTANGATPLEFAIYNSQEKLVILLQESGTNVARRPSAPSSNQKFPKTINHFGSWVANQQKEIKYIYSCGSNTCFGVAKIRGAYNVKMTYPDAYLYDSRMSAKVGRKKYDLCLHPKFKNNREKFKNRIYLCKHKKTEEFLTAMMHAESVEISIGLTTRTNGLREFKKSFRTVFGGDEERRLARGLRRNVAQPPSASSPPRQEKEVHAAAFNVNKRDAKGYTPLHHAALKGNQMMVRRLIRNGANVNAKAKNGATPLFRAAFRGHASVVDLLIANGANVNSRALNGATALHSAAYHGHESVVNLLIEKGADVNAETRKGVTPLDWAVRRGHKRIVRLLEGSEQYQQEQAQQRRENERINREAMRQAQEAIENMKRIREMGRRGRGGTPTSPSYPVPGASPGSKPFQCPPGGHELQCANPIYR